MNKFRYPVGGGTREDFEKNWYIAQGFGVKTVYGYHEGIDINLKTGGDTDLGEPLYAIGDWQLKYYHLKSHLESGFGKHFVYEVDSPWGKRWIHYAHIQNEKFDVEANPSGEVGDKLAELDSTGRPRLVMAAHLHMAVYKIDPLSIGIDTIATSLSKLNQYWEDPIEFLNNWYTYDMTAQETDKVEIKDIVSDGYSALTGDRPEEGEMQWRLESWESTEHFLLSLTGDVRFYKKYIQPQLDAQKIALEDACSTAISENDSEWQIKMEIAKKECGKRLEAMKKKNVEMFWRDIFELIWEKVQIWKKNKKGGDSVE